MVMGGMIGLQQVQESAAVAAKSALMLAASEVALMVLGFIAAELMANDGTSDSDTPTAAWLGW